VLGLAQQNITADRPFDSRLKSAVTIDPYDAAAVLRAPPQERRAQHDISEADDISEVVQWHLQALLLLDHDADGLPFQAKVCNGWGYVKRSEEDGHALERDGQSRVKPNCSFVKKLASLPKVSHRWPQSEASGLSRNDRTARQFFTV